MENCNHVLRQLSTELLRAFAFHPGNGTPANNIFLVCAGSLLADRQEREQQKVEALKPLTHLVQ